MKYRVLVVAFMIFFLGFETARAQDNPIPSPTPTPVVSPTPAPGNLIHIEQVVQPTKVEVSEEFTTTISWWSDDEIDWKVAPKVILTFNPREIEAVQFFTASQSDVDEFNRTGQIVIWRGSFHTYPNETWGVFKALVPGVANWSICPDGDNTNNSCSFGLVDVPPNRTTIQVDVTFESSESSVLVSMKNGDLNTNVTLSPKYTSTLFNLTPGEVVLKVSPDALNKVTEISCYDLEFGQGMFVASDIDNGMDLYFNIQEGQNMVCNVTVVKLNVVRTYFDQIINVVEVDDVFYFWVVLPGVDFEVNWVEVWFYSDSKLLSCLPYYAASEVGSNDESMQSFEDYQLIFSDELEKYQSISFLMKCKALKNGVTVLEVCPYGSGFFGQCDNAVVKVNPKDDLFRLFLPQVIN